MNNPQNVFNILGIIFYKTVYLPKTGNSKFKEGDVPELFNLKQDVGESDNLAQKYPDKVKELQELMQKY